MTDREADEYELALHRKSALRGFVLGGALMAFGTVVFLATGTAYLGLLLIPGALGRGTRVAVTWTDGQSYPGFVLEVRGAHVLVQFDHGKQDWAPATQVRPS